LGRQHVHATKTEANDDRAWDMRVGVKGERH
jgi:hypothetical protein